MFPIHTTRLAHLILLDFVIPVLFGEDCKLLSSYLRNFVQLPSLSLAHYSTQHSVLEHPNRIIFKPRPNST